MEAPGGNSDAALRSWAPPGYEDGRSISLNVTWGGHKLMLGCVYFPNVPTDRNAFIQQRIVPMQLTATAAGRTLILGAVLNNTGILCCFLFEELYRDSSHTNC